MYTCSLWRDMNCLFWMNEKSTIRYDAIRFTRCNDYITDTKFKWMHCGFYTIFLKIISFLILHFYKEGIGCMIHFTSVFLMDLYIRFMTIRTRKTHLWKHVCRSLCKSIASSHHRLCNYIHLRLQIFFTVLGFRFKWL